LFSDSPGFVDDRDAARGVFWVIPDGNVRDLRAKGKSEDSARPGVAQYFDRNSTVIPQIQMERPGQSLLVNSEPCSYQRAVFTRSDHEREEVKSQWLQRKATRCQPGSSEINRGFSALGIHAVHPVLMPEPNRKTANGTYILSNSAHPGFSPLVPNDPLR